MLMSMIPVFKEFVVGEKVDYKVHKAIFDVMELLYILISVIIT